MYNGMGLKTPKGSGTSGYTQANKFSVKPKSSSSSNVKVAMKGLEGDDVGGGLKKKVNKEMIEHERKRQIQVKLVMLEDQLIQHGYNDDEISQKVDEARKVLEEEEAAAAAAAASAEEINHQGRGIAENKWN